MKLPRKPFIIVTLILLSVTIPVAVLFTQQNQHTPQDIRAGAAETRENNPFALNITPTLYCLGGVPCNAPTTQVTATPAITQPAPTTPCVSNVSTIQTSSNNQDGQDTDTGETEEESEKVSDEQESGNATGFFKKLLELILRLIELILEKLLDGSPASGNPGTGTPATSTTPAPVDPCLTPTGVASPSQPVTSGTPTTEPVPTTATTPLPTSGVTPTTIVQPTTIQPTTSPSDPCAVSQTDIQTTSDSPNALSFFEKLIELILEFITKLIAWLGGNTPSTGDPGITPTTAPTTTPINPTPSDPTPTPCVGTTPPAANAPTVIPTLIVQPTVTQQSCKLTGKLDYSKAPDTEVWLRTQGIPALQKWYPVIVDAIAYPDYTPFCNVTIHIDPSYDGLAKATFHDQTITVQPKWIRDHPEDLGMLVHEGTHIIQAYPGNTTPGWVAEAIADWTREYIMKDRKPTVPKKTDSYTKGYGEAAYMLHYVETKYDPNIVRKLNVAAHKGTYTANFWTQHTGKTVDQLWAETLTTVP